MCTTLLGPHRGFRAGRFRQSRLRCERTYGTARAGIPVTARLQPMGQGARPQGSGALPRLRRAGPGGRVDQMGGVSCPRPLGIAETERAHVTRQCAVADVVGKSDSLCTTAMEKSRSLTWAHRWSCAGIKKRSGQAKASGRNEEMFVRMTLPSGYRKIPVLARTRSLASLRVVLRSDA
jgi:hypothetical protein